MRMPWEITREMFLSFEEVERLLRHVRDRATDAEPQDAVRAAVDRATCVLTEGYIRFDALDSA